MAQKLTAEQYNKIQSLLIGAGQGATLDYGDELQAALSTPTAYLASRFMNNSPLANKGVTDIYAELRDKNRAQNQQAQSDNPASYGTGEIGGAIATALPLGVPGGIAARLGQGVAMGTAYGQGASNASIGSIENAKDTAIGGAFGLGGGALGEVASPILSRVGGAVSDAAGVAKNLITGGASQNVEKAAADKIAQAFNRDNLGINDVLDALKAYGSKPATLMDAGGENTKGLVRAITRTPGEARTTLRTAAQNRIAGQEERVIGDLQSNLGSKDYSSTFDDLIASRSADAKPAYEAAYGHPENLMNIPEVADIANRPFFKDALRKAVDESRITGKPLPENVVAHLNSDGSVEKITKEFALDTRTADLAKRGMDSLINAAKSDPEKRYLLPAYNEARSQFVSAIDEVNPAYKAARGQFSGSIRAQEALEAGREAVTAHPDDIARTLGKLEGSESDFFKQGFQKGLQDVVENTSNGADAVKRVFNNTMKQNRLKQVLGNKYDDFARSMQQESTLYENAVNATGRGNSITAEALNDSKDGAQQVLSAVANGKSGILGLAERKALDLIDRGRGLRNEKVNARIADLLNSRQVLPTVPPSAASKTVGRILPLLNRSNAGTRLGAESVIAPNQQNHDGLDELPEGFSVKPQSANQSDYSQKLAQLESSGNATATNSSTSAKGAAQFTDSTWQHMVQKYGKANGLTRNGRNDPEQAAKAAELYAQENTPRLERALGRAPEAHELYLAHFLGAGGAAKILSSDPRASAAQVLPTAASKNRASFFDKSGKPYSVAQFYNNIQKKWENA